MKIKQLPQRWKEVELEEVAEVFNGKTPSEAEKREQGTPILKIKDVTEQGYFKGFFDSFVDIDFYNKYNNKRLKTGDTLILNAAHNSEYVGSKTFYVESLPKDTIATGEWLIVRSKNNLLNSKFKHYLIKSSYVKNQIKSKVKGIHLYPRDVKIVKIPIPFTTNGKPDIKTQQKIVSILERAEQLKEKRKKSIEVLDEYLKSVFSEMFLKKKFEEVKLKDYCSKISSGSTPLGGNKNYLDDGEILFIRSQNILMNKFSNHDKIFISKEIHDNMKRTWVKKNDVLLNITGASIGRTAIYLGGDNKANVNQHVCIIRIKNNEILNPTYINYYLSSQKIQKFILTQNSGATRQALTFSQIGNLKIPLPPLPLQQTFASIVKHVEKLKEKQKKSQEEIEALFNALMQKAFKGELD